MGKLFYSQKSCKNYMAVVSIEDLDDSIMFYCEPSPDQFRIL